MSPAMKTAIPQSPVRATDQTVRIPVGDVHLLGDLQLPEQTGALVIFAYGIGRNRNSPRCIHTAETMRIHGFGTLLCELLTDDEELDDQATGDYRNNVLMLSRRLVAITHWVTRQPATRRLRLGYFGACAGGAAALVAASRLSHRIAAVVCRGSHIDLVVDVLPRVKCPTLLVVGGKDPVGLELNRDTLPLLRCHKQLVEIPGASHLFGEPGKLEEMAQLSARWFDDHLHAQPARSPRF